MFRNYTKIVEGLPTFVDDEYEAVGEKSLLVINHSFLCSCESGLCFRHGVNEANESDDISQEEEV